MDGERPGVTPGDPLAGATGAYGAGERVPPGVAAPRERRPARPAPEDLAEWWRRALSVAVDGLVLGVLSVVIVSAIGVGVFGDGDAGVLAVLAGLLAAVVVFAALALLYAPLMMARTDGQTIGRMVAGCRVVRLDGRPVDFWWAAFREVLVKGLLVGTASALTGGIALLADGLWPLWDRERRALHDFLVDSRVVRS
jgi:uncharacterized RDD family membrane protein YckC